MKSLNIVTCFVALLAIMNPVGNIPLFLAMTEGMMPRSDGTRRW